MIQGCRPLTEPEIKQVIQLFDGPFALRDRALFVLSIRMGYRISELLSLRVKDCFQFGNVLDVIQVHRRHMKHKVRGRAVPVHQEAREALQSWLEHSQLLNSPNAFLFQSRKTDRQGERAISRFQAWKIFKEAFNKAGLTGKLATHSGRKTFANNLHQRLGRDITKTARALGHVSINNTIAYLSFDDSEVTDAILKPY